MRRFTILALMVIITVPAFGYGSKMLNDDIYVDTFYDTYTLEDETELAQAFDDYNITAEEFETYTEELIKDTHAQTQYQRRSARKMPSLVWRSVL
ncbi:hypothetical protein K8R78_07160 [bacterium]|nr:hypothetical protein [bacterium]